MLPCRAMFFLAEPALNQCKKYSAPPHRVLRKIGEAIDPISLTDTEVANSGTRKAKHHEDSHRR